MSIERIKRVRRHVSLNWVPGTSRTPDPIPRAHYKYCHTTDNSIRRREALANHRAPAEMANEKVSGGWVFVIKERQQDPRNSC